MEASGRGGLIILEQDCATPTPRPPPTPDHPCKRTSAAASVLPADRACARAVASAVAGGETAAKPCSSLRAAVVWPGKGYDALVLTWLHTQSPSTPAAAVAERSRIQFDDAPVMRGWVNKKVLKVVGSCVRRRETRPSPALQPRPRSGRSIHPGQRCMPAVPAAAWDRRWCASCSEVGGSWRFARLASRLVQATWVSWNKSGFCGYRVDWNCMERKWQ